MVTLESLEAVFQGFRMESFCENQSAKELETITRNSEDAALADRDRHCVSAQTDFSWKGTTGTSRGRIWNHVFSPTHMQEALAQRSLDL